MSKYDESVQKMEKWFREHRKEAAPSDKPLLTMYDYLEDFKGQAVPDVVPDLWSTDEELGDLFGVNEGKSRAYEWVIPKFKAGFLFYLRKVALDCAAGRVSRYERAEGLSEIGGMNMKSRKVIVDAKEEENR